ncbi:acetyltransferase [Rhodocytophaga rosea]|uniref:Acetyltransferase n=1 Tax=Rhodocytophaga rosea TaxID=2704465 RepID=A0A6C0GKQ9_9BACT|nr:acetyltransferase [Rhodocytophaga rosea]QHT68232.1 acetyltransferase [Rhodocytophaga rosea]
MLLYGASGHAKVIIDCLQASKVPVTGIFDDNPDIQQLLGLPVLGSYQAKYLPEEPLIIAVGNNQIRRKITALVQHTYGKVIHPSAIVSAYAKVDDGTVVFHHAVIQASASVGQHCIINTSASVDHDCVLENFVHISPNATLSGNVSIGEGTHIGAGATIIPGISIGKWCVIGAGAVVTKDIPDYAKAVGVPARIIKIKPLL